MASLFLVGLLLIWLAPETKDEDLPERLLPVVHDLIVEHPEKRLEMQRAMQSLAVRDAAGKIAGLLHELAGSVKGLN